MIKSFFSFLGFIFLIFLIWNRFIRERLPRDIYIHIYSLRFFITIVILFSFSFVIILSIKNIFSTDDETLFNKLLSNKYIEYVYTNIIIPIKKGPEQLYELMYDYIKISFILEPIHRFFFNFNVYNYCKYIILFLNIWRVIFVNTFILDVFYFQEFYYLYKIIYILIIPLISNLILFMINHHAKNLMEYLSSFVIADYLEEEQCFTIAKNPSYEKELTNDSIRYLGDLYLNALYTAKTFVHLKEMRKEISNYINIYVYTLYFMGWLSCLYFSSNFYYETPEIKISSGCLIITCLSLIYEFSLLIHKNRINLFIHKMKIKFFENLFMKRNNKHFRGFITDTIEKNVLLFYCIFNAVPKYLIIILFMLNTLIMAVPYLSKILLFLLLVMFFSNIYLYFLNKYINAELNKLECYFYFITEENTTNIYDKFPSEKHITSKNLDGDTILRQWIKLKEIETFIYYSITNKIKFNNYMHSIFSALLFITMILTNIC